MHATVSKSSIAVAVAMCCAVLIASRLAGQTPATGSISGVVSTDSAGSHGLSEVDVAIPALNLVARTNWLGEYRFSRVPAGMYALEARHLGYKPVGDSVRVAAGEVRLDFVLDQKAVTLESVVSTATNKNYISPSLRAFEERMNTHQGGSFVADSTLRKSEDRKLPEVLQSRAPGMTFLRAPAGSATYAYSARSTAAQCGVFQACKGRFNQQVPRLCYVSVYLDGIKLGPDPQHVDADDPPPDLNSLSVSDLAGVEFYAGAASVPMQYHNDNPCGTLLLWTREK